MVKKRKRLTLKILKTNFKMIQILFIRIWKKWVALIKIECIYIPRYHTVSLNTTFKTG